MRPLSASFLLLLPAALCSLTLTSCSTGNSSTPAPASPTTPAIVAPTVSSIAPSTLPAGTASTTLTVTGTNFSSIAAIQVGSVVEPTTFVSATQLTAIVPASQLASGAKLPVLVLNGTSASSGSVSLEIDNPAPSITGFTPSSFSAGATSAIIAVTGTGFVPTSVIQVNGTARSTTYVSGTEVNIVLTSADLAAAGSLTLTAVNAAPSGGTSSAASIPVNNLVPSLTMLSPATLAAGTTSPTTITLTGTNFTSGTTVQVGSTTHPATIASSSQLTFTLSVAEQANAGRLSITTSNPAPGGGSSNAVTLLVSPPTPTPTLSAVNPTSFIVGSLSSSLSVTGTNFTPSSVVQWNGTALTTNFGGSSTLYATVPASLLTAAGSANVTVSSPTALNPLSNSLPITISNPPTPTLTSISPGYGAINSATTLSVTGTGFTPATKVNVNGAALTTTYNNSTSLSVTIPASALQLPGNSSVSVTTPAPGGGTSAPQVFSAYIPLISNSSVYNPVDGLVYASVPGSVAAPFGNSIVPINPATGAFGTPIFVGSEPNKLALTSDGQFLWVGLDGSSAVRKVDLVHKSAGLQFSLPLVNGGIYQSPASTLALAALPGATDSVVVALSNSSLSNQVGLAIFDSGTQRANTASNTLYSNVDYTIQIDPVRREIYAGGGSYTTFSYNSNGLTRLANSSITAASNTQDEMQLLSGKVYTDFGRIYDAEAGALLGTLYVSGQTIAQGATLADATLGKIFVLDSSGGNLYSGFNQIQLFNLADYTTTGTTIPVNVPSSSPVGTIYSVTGTRLTRWGANGLLFRTPFAIYSLHSNSVVDLSSSNADLATTLATGGSSVTGSNTTFTAQVTNSGPSLASDLTLTLQPPSTGTVLSVTPSVGTCSTAVSISCSLGNLASGSSATVTVTVLQTSSGASALSAQALASAADPNLANNSATASVTVTGSPYSVSPTLSSVVPNGIQTGSTDTRLTINGAGFNSASVVMLGSTQLQTSFASSTQLAATVPAASLSQMGWAPVTVSTPAPGGGTSAPLPLTFFSVLTVGVNHILYDPFSRNLVASVGSGSSTVTGNSIAMINPATATIGTPVSVGSNPNALALSSDGQVLYAILTGSESVLRFNMLTGQPDFTYQIPTNSSFDGGIALRTLAVQPGNSNTIALDIASFTGNAIYDFNPTTKTAAIRGQASGPYSGSCLTFSDPTTLLAFDVDTSGSTLDQYTVTPTGLTYYNYSQYTSSTLNRFGCAKVSGTLAYANAGGIANPATRPATQVATIAGVTNGGGFSNSLAFAPDSSLQQAFYLNGDFSTSTDSIVAYSLNTFQPVSSTFLNIPTIEGSNYSYPSNSLVDMVRWGQDGLALLSSTGHIYLLRGAAVVPGLLSSGVPTASLGSVSSSTLPRGSGNTLLTLTGSGFTPGVAVTWNGSYRTTTIVDGTHLTVAIPAADLASAATATVVATNPGGSASNSLTVTVQ